MTHLTGRTHRGCEGGQQLMATTATDRSSWSRLTCGEPATPQEPQSSLSRDQVVDLEAARIVAAADRERRRTTPRAGPQPPDDQYE